jgi:CO/xanthine dehydrogenase Mo-binding subunit
MWGANGAEEGVRRIVIPYHLLVIHSNWRCFPMTQTVEKKTQYSAVGHSARRMDAEEKLTGRTRYAGDIPLPGLLHARLVLSPYAHARIVSIDTAAAEAAPGVVAVFTGKTLKMAHAGSPSRTQSPLALHEVYWCGHPVAVVVGETEAAAEDGAGLVEVEYEPLPVVIDPLEALKPGAPLARSRGEHEVSEIAGGDAHASISGGVADEKEQEALSENVSDKTHYKVGDVEAAWQEADVIVERTFKTSFVHQSYMEPQSIVVQPSPSGQQMTVWASSQGLFIARSGVADALTLPERQIHVESVPIGGAFGGKFGFIEPLGGAIAHAVRKPVRLVYTRQDDLLAGNPAPATVFTVKMGAKRDGTLVAMQARIVFDSGAYPGAGANFGGFLLASTYRCPNLDIRCYEVLTNKVSPGAYRAPGAPQATFALESLTHELCEKLGMDQIAFRKLNAFREGDTALGGLKWPRIGLIECLETMEQQPLWAERAAHKEPPAELQGWKIGYGLAVGGWPGGTEPAAAACRLEKDGTFTVVIGTVDLTGSDTSMALIAAEGLGVPTTAVNVAHDGTDTMPYSGGTGGSKTIYTMGPAVLAAARDARNQVLAIASEMLEASADDLNIEGDKVVVKGVPGKSVALARIAGESMRFAGQYEPVYGRGRSVSKLNSPMYAAHLAKVAVDPETGEVRVLEYVAVQDVGFAINPAEVEGQITGGVTQGLGWALFEGFVYDDNGQLLTPTLMDYALPLSRDVPPIKPVLLEIPSTIGPFGAKGVGEPPVVPVGAAIANAVYDAVGARVAQLPITPERLFSALHNA